MSMEKRFTRKLEDIKSCCGDICETSANDPRLKPGKYFDIIEKSVDCPELFACDILDEGDGFTEALKDVSLYRR